jgi:hypothetical protein
VSVLEWIASEQWLSQPTTQPQGLSDVYLSDVQRSSGQRVPRVQSGAGGAAIASSHTTSEKPHCAGTPITFHSWRAHNWWMGCVMDV